MIALFLRVLFVLGFICPTAFSKLVREEIVLTWEVAAPNGQSREVIKVNGQLPGPTFRWDEDDDVEVIVHNQMPFNTTIHWHGLLMQATPWSDGAPGITQLPIEIGQSFVYKFKAYPSGTHWYHSHSRMTLMDGLHGAIFIRPKPSAPSPWSLISTDPSDIEGIKKAAFNPHVAVLTDWTRLKSWEYMAVQEETKLSIFCVDSILINGKGSVFCPGEDFLVNVTSLYMKYALYPSHVNDKGCFPFLRSTEGLYLETGIPEKIPLHMQHGCVPSEGGRTIFDMEKGATWVSFSFVGAIEIKSIIVSIDEHPMWVYEADGQFIEPQLVDTFTIWPGERYAVMVKLDKPARDYTIRVADYSLTQIISAFATLRYHGGRDLGETRATINYGGQNLTHAVQFDRDHTPSFPPNKPAAPTELDAQHILYTHRWYSPWQYTLTGGGMYPEDLNAYLPLLYNPHSTSWMNESLLIRTKTNSWVDLVIQVGSWPGQPIEFPHMLHKHANKMWQIGTGLGLWNYSSVYEAVQAEPQSFNLENPNYRDTYVTSFAGTSWMVLRYQATNPGPWLFHCHLGTHLAGGMAMAILDGVDDWPDVPQEYSPSQRGFSLGPQPSVGVEGDSYHSSEELGGPISHPLGFISPGYWDSIVSRAISFLESLRSK
uniref:Laccase n=1 Tax=Chrysosporium merdarium TaxID=108922 RepID=A0A7H1MHC9_9EURO|nr:laccase [Chrysosporium merdarium]